MQIHFAFPQNQKKDNNQFKNKKKPRTARKLNCMDGSQTTKELKKKYLFILVGRVKTGNQGGEEEQ